MTPDQGGRGSDLILGSPPSRQGGRGSDLIEVLEARLAQLAPGVPVGLRLSRHESQGDLSTALPLQAGRDAGVMAAQLELPPGVERVEAVAPGFLNFYLSATVMWQAAVGLLSPGTTPESVPPLQTRMNTLLECGTGTISAPSGGEVQWAVERGRAALKMAGGRGLWPVPEGAEPSGERLTWPEERRLLRLLLLARSRGGTAAWQRATAKAFHDFYARVPVLALDVGLAQARLTLLAATLAALGARGEGF